MKRTVVRVDRGDPFTEVASVIGLLHTKDLDCTLDEHFCCVVCGVGHGDPCPECGQRAFHKDGCKLSDASEMERALAAFLDAGQKLVESWDQTKVRHYPYYLPSFDDFMADFTRLIEVEK